MTRLDELLIQAKSSAAHHADPAYRRAAAGSARAFLDDAEDEAIHGTSRAAGALATLMLTFHELSDAQARAELARSIGALVDAIRLERAAIIREAVASREPRRHWINGGADA